MSKNASGLGAGMFLLSSLGLLVGSIKYKPTFARENENVPVQNPLEAFRFACSHCSQHLTAEPEHIGQSLECPACGTNIVVPMPPFAAEPQSPVIPKKKLKLAVGISVAVLLVIALIAISGSSEIKFDQKNPEASMDRMAKPLNKNKKLEFGMALMSIGLKLGSETEINRALHGKTVDEIIAMAKKSADPETLTEFEKLEHLKNADSTDLAKQEINKHETVAPQKPKGTPASELNEPPQISNASKIPPALNVGESVTKGDLEFEVGEVKLRSELGKDFTSSKAAKGGIYLVVDWSYKNATRKPMSAFSKPDLSLLSPDGTEYDEDVGATSAHASEVDIDEKVISNLNPGISVQSASVFEVSKELLAEPGWRIQIKFKGANVFFAVAESPLEGLPSKRQKIEGVADSATSAEEKATAKAASEAENNQKLADHKGELAKLNTRMDSDRARYQAAINTINRLTNFKRTPVQEGSPAYYECLEASKLIKEIEAGAADLKSEKAKLAAMIQELEK